MLEAHPEQELVQDAERGECPDHGEQRPAEGAAQYTEQERRVRTRDHQVDHAVIGDAEDVFRARRRQRVVDRRCRVEQHETDREDAAADHLQGVAALGCGGDQDRQPDRERNEADAVRDAVGDFFAD